MYVKMQFLYHNKLYYRSASAGFVTSCSSDSLSDSSATNDGATAENKLWIDGARVIFDPYRWLKVHQPW